MNWILRKITGPILVFLGAPAILGLWAIILYNDLLVGLLTAPCFGLAVALPFVVWIKLDPEVLT